MKKRRFQSGPPVALWVLGIALLTWWATTRRQIPSSAIRPLAPPAENTGRSLSIANAATTRAPVPDNKTSEPRSARFEELQTQLLQLRAKPFWQRQTLDERLALKSAEAELIGLMAELGMSSSQLPPGVLADEFAFMDPERQATIEQELPADLQENMARFKEQASQGAVESDDYHEDLAHRHQKEDLLVQLLTPEELREYLARNSEESDTLRLHAVDLSREEFETVASIEWRFNRQAVNADFEELESVRQAREKALREALGDGFIPYQRSEDPTYAGHVETGTALGLSSDLRDWIYDVKHWVDQSETRIVGSDAFTDEDRARQLQQIIAGARGAIEQGLGRQFEQWASSPSASWLNRFDPTGP